MDFAADRSAVDQPSADPSVPQRTQVPQDLDGRRVAAAGPQGSAAQRRCAAHPRGADIPAVLGRLDRCRVGPGHRGITHMALASGAAFRARLPRPSRPSSSAQRKRPQVSAGRGTGRAPRHGVPRHPAAPLRPGRPLFLLLPEDRTAVGGGARAAGRQPYTDEVIGALPGRGIREVTVISPGSAVDCLGTLEELTLDADTAHAWMFVDIIGQQLTGWVFAGYR